MGMGFLNGRLCSSVLWERRKENEMNKYKGKSD